MIVWLTGQTGAGKSTLSLEMFYRLAKKRRILLLDGDDMRYIWGDLGFSDRDRHENNLRVARLAKLMEFYFDHIFISVIAPFEKTRKQIFTEILSDIKWIYVHGGKKVDKDHPYEPPIHVKIDVFPSNETVKEEADKVIRRLNLD